MVFIAWKALLLPARNNIDLHETQYQTPGSVKCKMTKKRTGLAIVHLGAFGDGGVMGTVGCNIGIIR
jgi:hypothetical protein